MVLQIAHCYLSNDRQMWPISQDSAGEGADDASMKRILTKENLLMVISFDQEDLFDIHLKRIDC